MKRIGIVASKVAKDNLLLYNFYVVLLSSLLSLLIFLLSAFAVLVGLALIAFITRGFMTLDLRAGLSSVLTVAMVTLAVVVGCINLAAVLINIKGK